MDDQGDEDRLHVPSPLSFDFVCVRSCFFSWSILSRKCDEFRSLFSSFPMSFPSPMYPAYCKRTPCSRAVRIQRDLRARYPTSRRWTRSSRQILQDILNLLTQKAGSLQSRMEALQTLLAKLPSWMAWSSREDDVVTSALRDLQPDNSSHNPAIIEKELADHLVQANGNVPYISLHDFDDTRDDLGSFMFLYTSWLSNLSSPEQKDCHVRDEHGQWIDDHALRDRFEDGWHLHIPTRTLHHLPQAHSFQRLTTLADLTSREDASPRRVSLLDDMASTITSSALHRASP